MCDVKQMFYQFRVNVEHRDFLRFLWWDHGDFRSTPVEYRMNVHLFGAVSSPGCANFGFKRIAKDNEAELGSAAADFIRNEFYVDDGLKSTETVEEAIELISKSREMCARGGLTLHKFVSNSPAVINCLPSECCANEKVKSDLLHEHRSVERALGVQWAIDSDSFGFRIVLKDQPLTRRGILSTVSSVYDPLGFIAPVILIGKQILQQMCVEKTSWDDPVSDTLRPQWERWRSSLFHLEHFDLKRCYKAPGFGTVESVELHHFSDASTLGYGQCSYLRLVDQQEHVHCSLVMGKSRVAPMKPVTIPRLELTAALVSIKVSAFLREELLSRAAYLSSVQEIFWTDSKVVLGYLTNEARRFHVFVANRVQQIHEHSDPSQWKYVGTDQNPADVASRGIGAESLASSKWLSGPDFLWKKARTLGEVEEKFPLSSGDPEIKTVHAAACSTDNCSGKPLSERLDSFSQWHRAKRAVANCLWFKRFLRSKATEKPRRLTVNHFNEAEVEIIRSVQREAFLDEWNVLKRLMISESPDRKAAKERNVSLKATSCLYRIDPFLDRQDLIRVGGRIRRSSLPRELKHPVILPRSHHVTQLVARHCHEQVEHQGRGMTTNEIRSNGFWIIGCSSVVASLIQRCVTCRKMRRPTEIQRMADLPVDRFAEGAPFTYCAVDLFGPWLIKDGRKELKRYGVLYTCLASRAVHLETANSLSTDSFINSFRRFVSVRGPVRQIRCDRGTNFVGAENELQSAYKEMDHERVRSFFLQQQCDLVDFDMNVPSASHMGGVWERQIRTVRSVLSSLLLSCGSQLDDESLRTFMSEAAAIVNSRPLTVSTINDPLSCEPLTPNHILTSKTKVLLPPPGKFQDADVYSRKRWRRVQYLLNEFWNRWKREYLQSLQTREKWVKECPNLSEGDVVLIKDEASSRSCWPLARVEKTYPGEDGRVRKVSLVLSDSSLSPKGRRTRAATRLDRPVQKLGLLLKVGH